MHVILACGRLGQEDHQESEVSLGYIVRHTVSEQTKVGMCVCRGGGVELCQGIGQGIQQMRVEYCNIHMTMTKTRGSAKGSESYRKGDIYKL